MKNRRGFTLLEMLISFALTAVILSCLFSFFSAWLREWKKVVKVNLRQQAESVVFERICRDVRNASQIIGLSGSEEVSLIRNGEKISYGWKNGKVSLKEGKGSFYLTSEGETSRLSFFMVEGNGMEVRLGKKKVWLAFRNI